MGRAGGSNTWAVAHILAARLLADDMRRGGDERELLGVVGIGCKEDEGLLMALP